MANPFVHLHCHTDYSLLDGACEISQLMKLAAKQKMPSVAMTDHGNIYGAEVGPKRMMKYVRN